MGPMNPGYEGKFRDGYEDHVESKSPNAVRPPARNPFGRAVNVGVATTITLVFIACQLSTWTTLSMREVLFNARWFGGSIALLMFAITDPGADTPVVLQILVRAFYSAAAAFVLSVVFYPIWFGSWAALDVLPRLYARAQSSGALATFATSGLVVVGIACVSVALFSFRARRRSSYGMTEAWSALRLGSDKSLRLVKS